MSANGGMPRSRRGCAQRHCARRTLACFVLAGALLAARQHPCAAAERTWEPGRATSDTLRGEVTPPDAKLTGDGVYGRFDGDLTLSFGLGAELGNGSRGAAIGRALYYHSAALVAEYADAFSRDAELRRVLFLGAEVRPLFLPRWSMNLERNGALLDLTLDSLSLGAGAYLAGTPEASFGRKVGFEGSVGFGVPLFATANGPWLEARGIWRPSLDVAETTLLVVLSVYASVVTPVVD